MAIGVAAYSGAPPLTRTTFSVRRDIQGLRAVAVLAVVGFHFGLPGWTGGFVGVDIFFVISGYLITGLLVAELDQTGRIDLLRFYGRRARRLLPAALLVTAATLLASAVILSPLEQPAVAQAAMAASLYASNYWFLFRSFDYFAPESALNPFLHTWSLGVEEQFYILWPGLLLLANRGNRLRLVELVMGATVLVGFALCLWLTVTKQPWAFFAAPARAWEFGLGGLASLSPVTSWARAARSAPALGWIGLLLLLLSGLTISEASPFPGAVALLPVAGTLAILVGGAGAPGEGVGLILDRQPFQWIGALSYSIYLWHWPIIVFASILQPHPSAWTRAGCFALTLAGSAVSYYLLEQPIRHSSWLAQRRIRSIGLGGALTAGGVALAVLAGSFAAHVAAEPVQQAIEAQTAATHTAGARGCLLGFTAAVPMPCSFGSATPRKTVVLLGDSHADEWSTPLVALAERQDWRLVTYLKSSCAAADIPVYNLRLRRFSPECAAWRQQALAEIVASRPDAVVIGEFSSGYILGPLTALGDNAVDLQSWTDGLRRTLAALQEAGIPVVLLRDTPTPGRNMRDCLARADWRGAAPSSCDTPRSRGLDAPVTDAERNVAASFADVHFVDLSSELCSDSRCPAEIGETIVYRDANHLTVSYAERLADPLAKVLVPILSAEHPSHAGN